jgi:hypothetical protein
MCDDKVILAALEAAYAREVGRAGTGGIRGSSPVKTLQEFKSDPVWLADVLSRLERDEL